MQYSLHQAIGENGDNRTITIFARNAHRATELFMRFLTILDKFPMSVPHLDAENNGDPCQGDNHLLQALNRSEEGLGCYDQHQGWTIIPLPDELNNLPLWVG
jgi:hypothetical protein